MAFAAGEVVTADKLNRATEKCIARGRRITASSTTTSIVGVLRLDGMAFRGGYLYGVFTNGLALDSDVNNDIIRAEVRYTTDGSSAGTGSSPLPGAAIQQRQTDAAQSENACLAGLYAPGSDETVSMLLVVRRISGSGNARIFADASNSTDMWIVNLGEDPGDTGVDV